MSDHQAQKTANSPHRRFNALSGEWVVVSPHRTLRPWQGHQGDRQKALPQFDENCYLCPGNDRAGGAKNPDYSGVFVFENDYPALLKTSEKRLEDESGLFKSQPICGICKVICYGPRHDQALHQMTNEQMITVIDTWCEEQAKLSQSYEWVQIFENRGALMGASSPHPHGQIWAVDQLPTEGLKELNQQRSYHQKQHRLLLLDYVQRELESRERVIFVNDDWACIVPYWAIWPFETILLPRFAVARLDQLNISQRASLAHLLKQVLGQYDRLFDAPMSFSMGWHSAPSSATDQDGWQLHAHIYPPALRSATIPKFMVGFELLAEKQRDITAEIAAARLRGEH